MQAPISRAVYTVPSEYTATVCLIVPNSACHDNIHNNSVLGSSPSLNSEQQGELKDPPLASPDDKDVVLGKEKSATEEQPSLKLNGDAIQSNDAAVEIVVVERNEPEQPVQVEQQPVQNGEEKAQEQAVENGEERAQEQPVDNGAQEQPVDNGEERAQEQQENKDERAQEQPVENGEERAQSKETTQVDENTEAKQSPQAEESRATAEPTTHTVNSPNHSLEVHSRTVD